MRIVKSHVDNTYEFDIKDEYRLSDIAKRTFSISGLRFGLSLDSISPSKPRNRRFSSLAILFAT